jgi:hypothetical protein
LGNLYFNTKAVIPNEFSHWATFIPSLLIAKCEYPPPGKIRTEEPLEDFGFGKKIDRVGVTTLLVLYIVCSL